MSEFSEILSDSETERRIRSNADAAAMYAKECDDLRRRLAEKNADFAGAMSERDSFRWASIYWWHQMFPNITPSEPEDIAVLRGIEDMKRQLAAAKARVAELETAVELISGQCSMHYELIKGMSEQAEMIGPHQTGCGCAFCRARSLIRSISCMNIGKEAETKGTDNG